MDKKLYKSTCATYNLNYHIVWATKYRRKLLSSTIINDKLQDILCETAKKYRWNIKAMEIMCDHVHIFIQVSPLDRPCDIVRTLKGVSSRMLRAQFYELRTAPSLWTRSYYVESIGCISAETIERYIANQKSGNDSSHV